MKFTCDKASILREVSVAQEIISSRNALSILSNVLIEVADNTLTLKATDLKVGFETQVPVEVAVPGSTTIYCDKFLGILRSLPDGEIEFEQQDNRLIIRPLFKKIDFQLKSITSDKYPEIQDVSQDAYFQVPQNDLIEMINQTIFAISDDETRFFMNGVYFEKSESALVMVATDGRRLSYIMKEVDGSIPDFNGVIIPPKILNLVRKLASGEGSINIAVTDKNIFMQFDNQKVSSNLIEGQFPNYRRVIPDSQEYRIVINRNELMDALRRVSLLVEQKSRRVYLTLNENSLVLNSEESEIGVAREEITCEYSGPEATIALNYLYLTDPLKVIDNEEIAIEYTEANKAISIMSIPAGDYFHIVMPMQLD
ncbi:DNA polymerase III subunit beta [Marispirochaeta aestuarii]|uniref:DNA polymerase III subunit beta n=1 Tax=Marispirochaeta aestuarii TaxID=1963862 RepID=UPI0029C68829|nr:DNA polymerase III subunit beta [Marispirochaeta aestuarii]